MDHLFAIKEEYLDTVVGYNGSGLPLGRRQDLDKLALLAHANPALARYFVRLPAREEIIAWQGGVVLHSTAAILQDILPAGHVPDDGTGFAGMVQAPPAAAPATDKEPGTKHKTRRHK